MSVVERRVVLGADGVTLHVAVSGSGVDAVLLSGGPGCVQYLEDDHLVPAGVRAWLPEPRGVGRSGGGPHDMAQAVEDLEEIRAAAGVDTWIVVGHSWGSDLAVRYALERPASVARVVGIAGHGLHKDRTWSQAYELGKASEPQPDIPCNAEVWKALSESFIEWIHQPRIYRDLADTAVPMTFLAAGKDIRPSWPLAQLAALVPHGRFETVLDVPHDFWLTHPDVWRTVIQRECSQAGA